MTNPKQRENIAPPSRTPAMTDPLEAQAREVLARLSARATQGDWQVQDGCSWRRIGTAFEDGNVLCPTTSRTDGHPDLTSGQGEDLNTNLQFMVAAVNYVREMLTRAPADLETVREAAAKVADRRDTGDMQREDMEARRIAADIRNMPIREGEKG